VFVEAGTLLHGPSPSTPDTTEHLSWLRGACHPESGIPDVLSCILTLTAQLAQGKDLLLIGPPAVTRNVRAALMGYLKLHHQQVPVTLWTHTPEEVIALSAQSTVRATLLVGGRPTNTRYEFRTHEQEARVITTAGPRTFSTSDLLAQLRGAYFRDVEIVPEASESTVAG